MATQRRKKMIRRKQVSTVRKTSTRWNLSQPQTVTLATGAGGFTELKTERSSKPGLRVSSDSPYCLKVIGRKVLVEEEPIELTPDVGTGLTQEVVKMISEGKLVVPEDAKYAVEKFPFKGTVLSVGERCKHIKVGDRIHFARGGVQRFQHEGKQFLVMHEEDVHGTYALLD